MTVLFLKQSEGRSTPSAVGFIADPVRPVRIPLARRPAGCGRSAGRSPWVVAARNRLEHLRPHSPPISRLQLRPASVGEAYEPAEASATPATRSKRMMHGFGRFVRIPRRLRCLDDRGRKCGLLGQAIAAARRRAGAQFMRRRCNRCRPQWLRAPNHHSLQREVARFWRPLRICSRPQHRRQIPFQFDLEWPWLGVRTIASMRARSASEASVRVPGCSQGLCENGDLLAVQTRV